ncbi:MAG: hypothetical protein ACTSPD_10725 [Promethearchaeota archaeon]
MSKNAIKELNSSEKKQQLNYFAIHKTQIIVGTMFLSVGIISLMFYDYGMLTFFFALPHFFFTGMLPLIFGFIILLRTLIEAEKVSISSNEKIFEIKSTWIKKKKVDLDIDSIHYFGIKYRETRFKRWMIIFLLNLITIEVLFQNSIDLWGFARIAPLLVLFTIIMFTGITLFVFFPRRYLEIGTSEQSFFILYKSLSNLQMKKLFQLLRINQEDVKNQKKIKEKLIENIKFKFSDFILGIFLIFLTICLMIFPSLFLGSLTRAIALTLGMKLILRVLNGDSYFKIRDKNNHLFLGNSIKLTFLKINKSDQKNSQYFSPERFHILEIICIFYLISQGIKYAFRFIWWDYASFSLIYFLIGITLIVLLFIRWFNPIEINQIKFKDFSIKIKIVETRTFSEKINRFLYNFQSIFRNKNLQLYLIIFSVFIIWSIIYNLFGGNFLLY